MDEHLLPLSPKYEEDFFKSNGYDPRWIPVDYTDDFKRVWVRYHRAKGRTSTIENKYKARPNEGTTTKADDSQ